MEGYIAETRMFAGSFAPKSWAFCDGRLMSITQNTALFALVGTFYGGDGRTTFALPDLRGRTPIGTGNAYTLGAVAGSPSVTLQANNLPPHNHVVTGTVALNVSTAQADSTTPVGHYFANDGSTRYDTQSDGVTMAPLPFTASTGISGGGQPISTLVPYTTVNYIICLEGIFPSRN